MIHQNLFKSRLKRLGLVAFDNKSVDVINGDSFREYIKIMYLHRGCKLTVDFSTYVTDQSALFFVAPNQRLKIKHCGSEANYLIFYNQDFYCIEIHDKEVACNGLLFNNVNNVPVVNIPNDDTQFVDHLILQIKREFDLNDTSLEEMVRTYLKQLLIKATRIWKQQHLDTSIIGQNNDVEFFRKFTLLVDAKYKEKHTVADYADVFAIAPKTLTHRFKRLNVPSPNEIIKNRIILEAKRLLVHTSMTAKEIAHELGYDDPAYFGRQFLTKTGESPAGFRAKYLETSTT
jgi:AraC-like DNA-binding protein